MDFRKRRAEHAHILIDRAVVEQVESFKFLGVHITNKLWSKHNKTVVKRAQQCLFPFRRMKRFGMDPQILKMFYSCTIENILIGCSTAWYGNCDWLHHCLVWQLLGLRPQVATGGSAYTGAKLPGIQDIYTRRCQRKALKISKDSSHPKSFFYCCSFIIC